MKIRTLIEQLPIEVKLGSRDKEIRGLASDSRKVKPFDLFIASHGYSGDGARHIDEAIANGACAIVSDLVNPFYPDVVQLVCPHPRKMEALLAARFFGQPSEELFTVGVTGTNGKTTVSYLLRHLLGSRCGLVGTVEYAFGKVRYPSERTTPDAITTQKLLREMLREGCSEAVLEVSSHGLDQGRVDEVDFDCAIFTNLSEEHLDYHGSMEKYFEAKKRLFTPLTKNNVAVLPKYNPLSFELQKCCVASPIFYGFTEGCDLFASNILSSPDETQFTLHYRGESTPFRLPLVGRHNLENTLAALAAAQLRGHSFDSLSERIRDFPGVPGRLELLSTSPYVYVDYAHTPDALFHVLSTLHRVKGEGRLILVFGCGGDRDKEKRPKMGSIAESLAEVCVITSDNPRSERPEKIADEILGGMTSSPHVILDRHEAIAFAMEKAHPQDLILIAGKGHESHQIFSNQTLPFSDREVVLNLTKGTYAHTH